MEWFSVAEKLPEEGERVIVFDASSGWQQSWYTYEPYECEAGGFDEYGFAISDIPMNNITHWARVSPPAGS
jgi:hypothetical protein